MQPSTIVAMADLSYNDITRGSQEGTKETYNLLQRVYQLVQQMGNVQQAVSQINTIQQQMGDHQRQLQELTAQLNKLNRQTINSSNADQRTAMIHQEISDLKVRFAAVERFAQDMSDYMHAVAEQNSNNPDHRI